MTKKLFLALALFSIDSDWCIEANCGKAIPKKFSTVLTAQRCYQNLLSTKYNDLK